MLWVMLMACVAQVHAQAPEASPEGAQSGDAGQVEAPSIKFEPAPALPNLGGEAKNGQVMIIPVTGTIDLGLSPFIGRLISEAEGKVDAVILQVDTFGGRVDAAVRIRDAVLKAEVPVIAYIDRRAISAGALISLAADHVVFAPGATLGAATPVQIQGGETKAVGEKMVSYMRSEMRATAEATGRNGDLAEAMVDADVEVPGVSPKGKLLTLTTDSAVRTGISTSPIDTLEGVLEALGLKGAKRVSPTLTWAEKLARFLTDPVFSGLLMSLGLLGMLAEVYSPGFGVPGALGLTCLALFFGGHMVVELAGWEEVLLFSLGVIALLVEVFVIPGFGVVGVVGIVLIVISLVMAMNGLPTEVSWQTGALARSVGLVMVSLVVAVVGSLAVIKFLPKSRLGGRMVLEASVGRAGSTRAGEDESFTSAPTGWARYVGERGEALTDLRLSGKAKVGSDVLDVVSQTEYLTAGTPIRVVQVEGVRIVVVREETDA